MRKLIEYMPPFLKDVREFNRIFEAEDIEIEKLNSKMNLLLTEVIVNLAESFGLDRYEKIYNINNTSTNIEARRAAILASINNRVGFTYKWLYNYLRELFGEDGFELNIDYNNYRIEIIIKGINSEVADALIESLYEKIPANLERVFGLVGSSNNYNIAATIVQKEESTLFIDTSIIKKEEFINSNYYIAVAIKQTEYMYLKEG